jgi:hypothetical protein
MSASRASAPTQPTEVAGGQPPREAMEHPAKLLRIAAMVQAILNEVRTTPVGLPAGALAALAVTKDPGRLPPRCVRLVVSLTVPRLRAITGERVP